MPAKPFTVYALIDPTTFIVRYIGQTDNITRRYKQHCNQEGASQPALREWIVALAQLGHIPTLAIMETCETRGDSLNAEQKWIGAFTPPAGKGRGPLLNNLTLYTHRSGIEDTSAYKAIGDVFASLRQVADSEYGDNAAAGPFTQGVVLLRYAKELLTQALGNPQWLLAVLETYSLQVTGQTSDGNIVIQPIIEDQPTP